MNSIISSKSIKKVIMVLFCYHLSLTMALAQGYPVIRNYTAEEYGAHNCNYDIEIDDEGIVYVANFEGLLYYDQAQWRMLYTPSINRITVVYKSKDNTIWIGGYNYFGQIKKKDNGEIYMARIGKPNIFNGEVEEIFEADGKIMLMIGDKNIFEVSQDATSIKQISSKSLNSHTLPEHVREKIYHTDIERFEDFKDIIYKTTISKQLQVQVRHNQGLFFTDGAGHDLYSITEKNGLCSNNVAYVVYDGHGVLWGATDHGIFAIEMPSPYSFFLPKEGLTGDVHAITEWNGKIYVGTSNGLFMLNGKTFNIVADIDFCCWKLFTCPKGMLAATANGIYFFASNNVTKHLTQSMAFDLLLDGENLYCGEHDGVYLYRHDSPYKKICNLEQVTKMYQDGQGCIWLQNSYGIIYNKPAGKTSFVPYDVNTKEKMAATLVPVSNSIEVISAITTDPFPYPTYSTIDNNGITWLTNNEGKHLYQWKDGKRLNKLEKILFPFSEMTVSALYSNKNKIWIGGDNILAVIDTDKKEAMNLYAHPQLKFRSIILGADSVLWGGCGKCPNVLPTIGSHEGVLHFSYAIDYVPLTGNVLYRHKLNNGRWSAWDNSHEIEFTNLSYGSYQLSIQARLANGDFSEIETINFAIAYPFYLRWYMIILYVLLFVTIIFSFFRLRLKKLRNDKIKLEKIVQERTSEIVKQKDEIEEKSKSLEQALNDLGNAQNELIRQEKMATVGKLTQGLIDRILNPLNYINNFSKLSEGLVKDIEANIEDEKENMDEDNYEDTMDVLNMLRGNLQKVGEHGKNTTRTLKAMEEMLKDRSGSYHDTALAPILRQNEEMVKTYYANEIAQYHIETIFDIPDDQLMINGNADLLSKTFMSILGNSVYAIIKKAQQQTYTPQLAVTVTTTGEKYNISIRDNGIGIEDTIIDKIFDPFFTTKTTGEAAGVGLYLSREIIQNHSGDISVQSVKNEYSEFIITLPALKQQ